VCFPFAALRWEDTRLIEDFSWRQPKLDTLRIEAADYIRESFKGHPLWGFKDPRSVRHLPFWQPIFESVGVDVSYVIAIRNPPQRGFFVVRASGNGPGNRPNTMAGLHGSLSMLKDEPFVVTDYDLLMADPGGELKRIAHALKLSSNEETVTAIEDFVNHSLDQKLRHSFFKPNDFDLDPSLSPLAREAYL
jgi:hypothetical protein